jgi:hypothetical protein
LIGQADFGPFRDTDIVKRVAPPDRQSLSRLGFVMRDDCECVKVWWG